MIRPTFLGFETARRALNISQAGLDIVGHNISNAQTAGYTRQRVDQVSMSMNGISTKYQTFGAAFYGSGANIQGIRQVRDPYLDNRYRTEATVNGELGVKSEGLTDINNIFDETMADGLSSKLSELLNTLTVLGQSANIKEHAMVARDTMNQFVQILNKNARQLEEARAEQMNDLTITVEQDVNTILSKIADLNKKIKEDNFYGNPSNELNDERNMLIDNLSEYFDIKVVRTPVKVSDSLTVETVSIELNNSGTPPLKLIDGSSYNKLSVAKDPKNGNAVVSLVDGISGLPMFEDLSTILTKGGIKGYIDIINGEGPNSEGASSNYRGIPYYMKALDEYAQQFAEIINRVNNITDQEAADSGASYDPVLSGTAKGTAKDPGWLESIRYGVIGGTDYGSIDFSGRNTNVDFAYDGTDVTATFTDENGDKQVCKAAYSPNAQGEITFYLCDSSGNPTATEAFTAKVNGSIVPEATSQALIDAGWPPVTGTDGNKNLVVPLVPSITDNVTGNKPAWIDTISGGVMQFSGKEYGIDFGYNSADGSMTATIDGKTYTGTYAANGKVDFKDPDTGAVMFTVKTTGTAPDAATSTTVDATITAKNISISQNWLNDPLYITTTKSNAPNKKESTLALEGTKNPTWLNKVSMGANAVSVPNGSYQFTFSGTGAVGDPRMISVKINGIEYKGEYTANSTIELKGGNPEKVGLVIETNHKTPAYDKSEENVASIKTDTGSMNDNINKLLTEMKRSSNYGVSGINGNLEGFLTSFQAQMGSDKNSNDKLLDASLITITTLANRRDSISAVSIDEEGVNMMTYQNYYNAAARFMTTLDEALDKIINGMGTVGR